MGAILLIKYRFIAVHDSLIFHLIRPTVLILCLRSFKPWIEGRRRELLAIGHGFR
ncbi:hypothetical protein A2U01_0094418, partial [Trifolium medium]|nr:hypothetical protein [Trifolium medium]